ncbi:hypothetical protein Taro_032073 [Colocasia esculenta]|uniref:Uncharacterized protein n=1 Tax=Colocasia esculenta TaxID=4460 RepID=A0A843VTT9_COLES|nr:hypothetical protein [Colocasia esculenta]
MFFFSTFFRSVYKKHYPPSLRDEVWRLERIGKEGAFHQKLRAKGINTVQEFLKLWVVDPARLRDILGTGMSDRVWEGTVGHARTCNMGSKLYLHRSPQCTLLLDPICQVQGVLIDGHIHPPQSLHGPQQNFLRQLAREAYEHWEQLEEVDETFAGAASQQQGKALPQIAMQPSPSCSTMYHHTGSQITPAISTNESSDAFQVDTPMASGWAQSPGVAVVRQSSHAYNVSKFSPEGDQDPNPPQGLFRRF